jgi:hypothetical protein
MPAGGRDVTEAVAASEGDLTDGAAALLAANINPATGLATDYLNHFNEITMLIDLVPDMPEVMDEIRAWRPASYEGHFERSSFTTKALALSAYRSAAPSIRSKLAQAIADLDAAILDTVAMLEGAPMSDYGSIIAVRGAVIRPLMGQAASVIHGVEFDETAASDCSQVAVDALLG